MAPGALKEGRHRRATEFAEVSASKSALRVLRSSAVPGRSKFMERPHLPRTGIGTMNRSAAFTSLPRTKSLRRWTLKRRKRRAPSFWFMERGYVAFKAEARSVPA